MHGHTISIGHKCKDYLRVMVLIWPAGAFSEHKDLNTTHTIGCSDESHVPGSVEE